MANPVLIFGILGDVLSWLVYLAPIPTFRNVYEKKSTAGLSSLLYIVSLFGAMLWLYYGVIENDEHIIATNSFGCVTQTLYLVFYYKYSSGEVRKKMIMKQIIPLNVCLFGFILLFTLIKYCTGDTALRVSVVGWFCSTTSCCVYAAPLASAFQVYKTKSVEFMQLPLLFCLTLSSVMWFSYGSFKTDPFVTIPNVLGFVMGVFQMILYAIYRNSPKKIQDLETSPVERIDSCETEHKDMTEV